MTMQAVANKLLDDLILRGLLVVGERPIGPGKLRTDVERLLSELPAAEQWKTTLEELEQAGMLKRSPLTLTDTGRVRALAFLELEALPPDANWGTLQSRCLVPRALGIPSADRPRREKLKVANNLRAAALRKFYDLPIDENSSLRQSIEAVACKLISGQLQMDPVYDFEALQIAVFNRLLQPTEPLTADNMSELMPGSALGATRGGLQGLREMMLSRWLDSKGEAQPATRPPVPNMRPLESRELQLDPTTFAGTVLAAARSCPTGRWGDSKVFIGHLWRQLQQEPNFPRLDLAAFKERLVEANQRGLLRLERAEVIETMNPDDVRDAETKFMGETYHFLQVERNRP